MYLGDHKALAAVVMGTDKSYAMFVDTRDIRIAPHLLMWGVWEEWVTKAMEPHLKGALFVDGGANFGWYSLLAHSCKARKIVAFEPQPRAYDLFCQTLAVNGVACEAHHKALGHVHQELSLAYEWSKLGDSTFYPEIREKAAWDNLPNELRSTVTVPVVPLGEVLSELYDREPEMQSLPVVMKLDVEGFEPEVVQGSESIIREKDCVLFIEHNRSAPGQDDMLHFLKERQYSMSVVTHDAKLKTIQREQLAEIPSGEMLCFRRFPI